MSEQINHTKTGIFDTAIVSPRQKNGVDIDLFAGEALDGEKLYGELARELASSGLTTHIHQLPTDAPYGIDEVGRSMAEIARIRGNRYIPITASTLVLPFCMSLPFTPPTAIHLSPIRLEGIAGMFSEDNPFVRTLHRGFNSLIKRSSKEEWVDLGALLENPIINAGDFLGMITRRFLLGYDHEISEPGLRKLTEQTRRLAGRYVLECRDPKSINEQQINLIRDANPIIVFGREGIIPSASDKDAITRQLNARSVQIAHGKYYPLATQAQRQAVATVIKNELKDIGAL